MMPPAWSARPFIMAAAGAPARHQPVACRPVRSIAGKTGASSWTARCATATAWAAGPLSCMTALHGHQPDDTVVFRIGNRLRWRSSTPLIRYAIARAVQGGERAFLDPLPRRGAGYFSYELGRQVERLPAGRRMTSASRVVSWLLRHGPGPRSPHGTVVPLPHRLRAQAAGPGGQAPRGQDPGRQGQRGPGPRPR